MRARWKRMTAFLLSFLLLLGSAGMEAFAYGSTSKISVNVQYNQTEARKILARINDFRTQGSWYYDENNTKIRIEKGELGELTWDYMLEKIAMLRAAEAAIYYTCGDTGHGEYNPHTRLNGKSFSTAYKDCVDEEALATGMSTTWYGSWAENLAFGHTTEESVFNAWGEEDYDYSGQGHRRIMLGSAYQTIGVAQVVYNGRIFWALEMGGENSGYPDQGAVNSVKKMTLDVEEDYVKYDGTGSTTAVSVSDLYSNGGSSNNSSSDKDNSQTAKPVQPLSAVEGLQVSATRYNTLELRWNPVSGAKSYEVYYADSDNVSSARRLANAKKNSYKFTKAKCGQPYYFWVIPVAGKTNKGSLSAAPMAYGETYLTGSTDFTVAKPGYNSIKLKWNKVPGAKKYLVECSTDLVNWTTVFEKGGTGFTHKKLETGETYYYRIRAQRDSCTTDLEEAGFTESTTVLGHVTKVKVSQAGTDGLKLSWRKVPGVAYYEVYRLNRETGEYDLLTPGRDLGRTKYVDAGLAPAATYTYKVIGFTAGGKRQTDLLQTVAPTSQTTKAPR